MTGDAMVELADAWTRGWAVSRGTAAPVAVPGGYRIEVGLPKHRVRYVLPHFDADRIRALGEELTAPGTWIKVFADPEAVMAALPPGWVEDDARMFMMTTTLGTTEVAVPDGYSLKVSEERSVLRAALLDGGGNVAAQGQAGVSGDAAVMDQVVTEPEHRRRGLGKVVMTALGHEAALRGIDRGVLGATVAGRGLYLALGWEEHCPLAAAYRA